MQDGTDPDALLTPSEVAEMFRVNPKTVTRWASAGNDAAWQRWNEAWRANRQFTGVEAAHSIADAVEHHFAGEPDIARLRPDLLAAFAGQGEGADLKLLDGVADVLAALSERGIR